MDGVGRFRVLAVWAPDPIMSLLAPVGLAASAGTALIVDMISRSAGGDRRTLLDVMTNGPRLDEISPGRSGVATIQAGPISTAEASQAAELLASRWPAVVVRAGSDQWPGPVAPVHVLYGFSVETWEQGAAVWQSTTGGERPPGPGPTLPRVSPRQVRNILNGWMPRSGRWTRSWRKVWDMPWA